MKALIGYIFEAALITLGMYIFILWIESIKNKDWGGVIIYLAMWILSFLAGASGILHLKGWI